MTEDQELCPWCGEVTDTRAMMADPTDTDMICEPCFEDIDIRACEWCGDRDNTDSMTDTGNDEYLCNDCIGEAFECDDCSDILHTDEARYVGGWRSERVVCDDCYEGSYFYCEGCDESMSLDMYGSDGYCNECEDEDSCDCGECGNSSDDHEGIRRWGDTPDLIFHDTPFIGPVQASYQLAARGQSHQPAPNKYYLGMEIELSHTRGGIIADFVNKHHDMMWATTDATVDDGFEVVTMPLTFDAWRDSFPWGEWTTDIHDVVPNQEGYTDNGIHVHISRSAFANSKGRVLASHLYKFMQFIRVNEDAIMTLAGRGTHSYCRWDQQRDARDSMNDAKASTSTRNYERYRPINTQNRQTIELRFFDGRSDPVFMKRAIQFIHSVCEFTRHGNANSDRTWEVYTTWVSERNDTYPELNAYLNQKARRLLMGALTSEHRYKDQVLPRIKADKAAAKQQVRREREAQLRRDAEVRRLRDSLNTPCVCDICSGVDGIVDTCNEASAGTILMPGDFIRDYMDGQFHVNVYQISTGQRHDYRHVINDVTMVGTYYMSAGFQGDVEQDVWNTHTNSYETVTLQREAR